MSQLFQPWEDIKLPDIPQNQSYGFNFPKEMNQLMRELKLFSLTWNGKIGRSLERWEHGINVVRMLWSQRDVALYADWHGTRIWNVYFLNVFKKLCDGRSVCLTGPASASKTFAAAVYNLICFFSAPTETSALLSTTSGSSAERRLWGQMKSLHNSARFSDWIEAPNERDKPAIGRVVDYIKCVTFDPGREIDGNRSTARDLRNGAVLIPIAQDSTGDNALDTIIGTHNKYVLWTVDELPTMMSGVMRPRANLLANEFHQFIGIGNAADKTDEHGRACEPKAGWESIDENISREWRGKTLDILFLHGEESPNDHPAIDKSLIRTKSDYPFPFLSNEILRNEIAEVEGEGDVEEGKQKLGYRRMAIGFWPMDGTVDTILTEQFVRKYGAHEAPEPWGADGFTTYWGLDPAFTSDGDENILFPVKVGRTYAGMLQIVLPHDGIRITPNASTKDDYRMQACAEIKKHLTQLGARPENGCMDAMNDGGLLYADLSALLDTHKIQALTSLGKSPNSKYIDWVTDYWYSMVGFVKSGYVRGFNTKSGYARDLFARRYETGVGRDRSQTKVESKREMKERIGRSPDRGDACSYTCWLVNSRLGIRGIGEKEQEQRKKYADYFDRIRREEPNDLFSSKAYSYEDSLV